MPDADGTIHGVSVPAVPWTQRFNRGDRVRVAAPRRKRDERYLDCEGTVDWADEYTASVFLDAEPPLRGRVKVCLFVGELRPVASSVSLNLDRPLQGVRR